MERRSIFEVLKKALASVGIVIRVSSASDVTTDPTITAGAGAPSATEPNGSLWLRTNGTVATAVYARISGAWVAIAAYASNAALAAIAALTPAANKIVRFTSGSAAELLDCTAAGAALLDDADASAQRTTLGLVIGTNVQAFHATLTALVNGTAIVLGPTSSPVTTAQVLTNSAAVTLPTTGNNKKISSASAVTGITMTVGTVDGQSLRLLNVNPSGGDTITFHATPATSKVSQGTHAIPAGTAKDYTWDNTGGLWYPVG